MNNSEYWAKRFTLLEEQTNRKSQTWKKQAQKQFERSLVTIDDKLSKLYTQLEETSGLSLADAKRAMDEKSLSAFKITLEEYIELGESLNVHFDSDVLKTMILASDRVRISRWEAIKLFIEAEIARLYAEFQVTAYDKLGEAYENRYYRTAYEMRSVGFSFDRLNKEAITQALDRPWNGVRFSETIWTNQKKLQKNLTDAITQSFILGQSYTKATEMLEAKMKAESANCARIITTEMAAVSSKAQQEMFKELDVKKYEIVATLDTRTSQICQRLDGKQFKMSEYEVGVTAPPFHPHCRTTTACVTDFNPTERIARDKNGKSVYVKNQSYLEWAKENDIEPVYGLWRPEE